MSMRQALDSHRRERQQEALGDVDEQQAWAYFGNT